MTYTYAPVIISGFLAAFLFSMRRIALAAQPLRLEMAEKGESLLAEQKLSEDAACHVRFMLDRAFGMRWELLFGFVAVPFIVVALIFKPNSLRALNITNQIFDPAAKAIFLEIEELHEKITFANNPILITILKAEMLLFLPVAVFFRVLLRGMRPDVASRDVMVEVEGLSSFIGRKFRHQFSQ